MSNKKSKPNAVQGNLFDLQVRKPLWDVLPMQVKSETMQLVRRMVNEYVRKTRQSEGGGGHD